MSLEDYPDDVDIVETSFKTDQQSDAAERIAEEWPVDLERLAEEGQHVKMFYKQVLDQFLGPAEADATFAEIKDEHGSLEEWIEDGDSDDDDVEVPDIEDIEPGAGDSAPASPGDSTPADSDGSPAIIGEEAGTATVGEGENVDAQRRAWFRAGFREGVEFAAENPEMFDLD
ncbi:MAG: hypothetical protein V5A34_05390 [Halapricum sp.]